MCFLYGGLTNVKKEMTGVFASILPQVVMRQLTIDNVLYHAIVIIMEIGSIRHKALHKFAESGQAKGLDKRLVGRLRNMIAFLDAAGSLEELKIPPNFGFHILSGGRAGQAIMTVTKNWRLTFRLNDAGQIIDLDLEDYH